MNFIVSNDGRLSAARQLALLVPVALALFVGSLSASATPIAAPRVADAFDAFPLIPWFVSAFLLASTIAAPIFGKLGDLYGRKRIVLVALAVFGAAGLLAGLSTSMEVMVAIRVLQGLGAGGLMVTSMALIADVVPPADRAKVHGAFSWVFSASTVAGPVLGGLAVDYLSWRWVFLLNAPAALAVALAVVFTLPGTAERNASKSFDIKGAAALSVMLTAMLAGTGFGTSTIQATSQTLAALALAAGAAVVFVKLQRSAPEPLLPLALFGIREYALIMVFMAVLGAIMFVEITYLPLFLQKAMGMSGTESGAHQLSLLIGVLISSTLSGQFASKTGNAKLPLVAGCILMAVSMLLIAQLDAKSSLLIFHLYTAGLGIGMGPAMSLTIPLVQNLTPPKDIGAATASAGMFRSVGGSLGIMLFGAAFSSGMGGRQSPEAFEAANSVIFLFGAALAVLGAVLLAGLKSGVRPPR